MQQIKIGQQASSTNYEFLNYKPSAASSTTESHSESNNSLNFEELRENLKKKGLKPDFKKKGFTSDQEEEEQILNLVPLKDLQEREKQLLLQTQLFLRKHAPVLKKHILLAALNLKMRKEGQKISIKAEKKSQGDVQYMIDLQSLMEQADQQNELPRSMEYQSQFPEMPLLMLAQHPLVIEYFSDNVQLLYWMDRMSPIIQKEWVEFEHVEPCYQKEDTKNERFNTQLYPHYCWHKVKRMLPLRILEEQFDQLQPTCSSSINLNFQDRKYLSEALSLIREQKGVNKVKTSNISFANGARGKKKQDQQVDKAPSLKERQYSQCCYYKTTETGGEQKLKDDFLSQGSQNQGNNKRDEKKDTIMVCGYCSGAYHLSCIVRDPKWNKSLPQVVQIKDSIEFKNPPTSKNNQGSKKKKMRKCSNIQELYDDIMNSEPKDLKFPNSDLQKKKPLGDSRGKQTTAELLKEEVSAFQTKVGYKDKTKKWACKNCLFRFVIDHLASLGDLKFQLEIGQSDFVIQPDEE